MPIGYTRLTTSRKLAGKQGIFLLLLLFNRGIKYLNDKTFLILCEDNSQTQIRFFQDDFKHLTGLYSDLDDVEFYKKCQQGIISTGNIDTLQKYDWSTLKKKTGKIEHFHDLLYSKANKSLLLNQLRTHTTVFPVAIRNDAENICVGFVDDINKARSLRNANNSHDAEAEKQIMAILGKKNGNDKFEEIVYIKEGYELYEQNSVIIKGK